jgi:hypothetical protein
MTMPRRRQIHARQSAVKLTHGLLYGLLTGNDFSHEMFLTGETFKDDDTREAIELLWKKYGDAILAANEREFPGTKPAAFYWFNAPKQKRVQCGRWGSIGISWLFADLTSTVTTRWREFSVNSTFEKGVSQ